MRDIYRTTEGNIPPSSLGTAVASRSPFYSYTFTGEQIIELRAAVAFCIKEEGKKQTAAYRIPVANWDITLRDSIRNSDRHLQRLQDIQNVLCGK